jgi:hypothetical protein
LPWVEGEAYWDPHGDDNILETFVKSNNKYLWTCKRLDLKGVANVWKTSSVCKRNYGVLYNGRISIKQCFSPWFTFLLNNFFGIGHKLKQKELSLVDIMINLQRCK